METLNNILNRCSIRQFKDEPISKNDIKTILEAGFAAPSACNMRPYHFMIIDDKELMEKLAETAPGKKVMLRAPICIAVVGDLNINPRLEFVVNDASACIENMLLAISDLGLGGCWLGQRRDDSDQINQQLLCLPNNCLIIGFIAVGHPNETKVQKNRYDESKIHYNKW